MNKLLLLLTLVSFSAASMDLTVREATAEELAKIEQSMDQMKFTLDPSSVKMKHALITDQTYCGRMDATRKNGTKMVDFTVYGTWFGGEVVSPIATGAAARRMCDLDKFPKN